jgi:magnesium transporter
MLRLLSLGSRGPEVVEPGPDFKLGDGALWVDLINPSKSEELAAEKALGLSLPTREEMAEIESSSRLYREDGAVFMTASLLAQTDTLQPKIGPVTFVLAGKRLITIRYIEPKAFSMLCAQAEKHPAEFKSGADVFFGLLDPVIDRLADALEHAVVEVDSLSGTIFRNPHRVDFGRVMKQLGRSQDINVKVRESAASLMRLLIFAANSAPLTATADERERVAVLERDLASVIDHSGHLSANITFLLDSALGLINVEQNSITKILSVATVVFLPPTLLASYFGMNFQHMPELSWPGAQYVALALMILSVVGTLVWLRRKGWL